MAVDKHLGALAQDLRRFHPYGDEATTEVSDQLVEYIPSQDHKSCVFRFRPGYVVMEVTWKNLVHWVHEWDRITHFTINGHVFEAIVHDFSFEVSDSTSRPLRETAPRKECAGH